MYKQISCMVGLITIFAWYLIVSAVQKTTERWFWKIVRSFESARITQKPPLIRGQKSDNTIFYNLSNKIIKTCRQLFMREIWACFWVILALPSHKSQKFQGGFPSLIYNWQWPRFPQKTSQLIKFEIYATQRGFDTWCQLTKICLKK